MVKRKVKIEKNTVQETLVIPLYGKAWAVRNYPDIFKDTDCEALMAALDYDFSVLKKKEKSIAMKLGSLATAMRQYALAQEVKEYLKDHPNALIVNMGCGLDTTGHLADNGTCRFVNVDFPNVIEVREALIPSGEREKNVASDLNDLHWFDTVGFRKEDGAIFIASGVFIYFKKSDVKKLFCAMAERFPGARLAFDAQNRKGMELDLKAIKASGIDIGTNFCLDDPERELLGWCDHFVSVRKKGMMAGYMKSVKRFGMLYRLLAAYSDKSGMSQLDVIEFKS